MRHVIGLLVLAGCTVHRAPSPATHPANPAAPAGRLAGAPPSLRAGVVDYQDVPPLRDDEPPPSEHQHHGH
jgi:hypothetical protein